MDRDLCDKQPGSMTGAFDRINTVGKVGNQIKSALWKVLAPRLFVKCGAGVKAQGSRVKSQESRLRAQGSGACK